MRPLRPVRPRLPILVGPVIPREPDGGTACSDDVGEALTMSERDAHRRRTLPTDSGTENLLLVPIAAEPWHNPSIPWAPGQPYVTSL